MHGPTSAIAIAVAIAAASGGASAMTTADKPVACRVVDAGKLARGSGGAAGLCRAIEAAAARQHAAFAVEVRVKSPSALVATVRTKDGRTLPELNLAVSDGTLSPRMVQRFAAAIAAQAAGAAKR